MTQHDVVPGGCYCGSVRYTVTGAPVGTGICHCESCRRTAGAESVAWAVCREDQLAITGTATKYESSPGVERTFCATCGTNLTYRRVGADTIDITLASLDDPEALPPRAETWCEDRVSWNALHSALPHHERGSSSPQLAE